MTAVQLVSKIYSAKREREREREGGEGKENERAQNPRNTELKSHFWISVIAGSDLQRVT
jgi:hypothetical protein